MKAIVKFEDGPMGYGMREVTLGLILGGTADTSFRQALSLGNGSIVPLLSRTVGNVLIAVVLVTLISGAIKTIKATKSEITKKEESI